MTSLARLAASGTRWSAVSQFGRQLAQFVTSVVLARLLTPSDFGLVGMAMVIIGFVGIFRDLGTASAIIREGDPPEGLLSSIFWVNLLFGALAMVALYAASGLGEVLYDEPRLAPLLQALSPTFLLAGLGIVHQSLLERSLSFSALARLELFATATGAVAGIGLAIAGAGVWSLVVQSLATTLVSSLVLWRANSWRPRWTVDWVELKRVGGFSLNLVGFNVLNYFSRNGDYFLIGRYLGAQELGLYTLAYRIMLLPLQSISAVLGRVMYPVLSGLRDDPSRFTSIYLRTLGGIGFVAFPIMLGVFALAEPFVVTVFGEQWRAAIPVVMIFAPVGLVQSIITTVGWIYQTTGRTDLMFRWGVFTGALALGAFAIGLRWGIIGVAAAYAVATALVMYPNLLIPYRLIGLDVREVIRVVRLPFVNAVIMLLALYGLSLVATSSQLSNLLVGIAAGGAVFLVANWLTNRRQVADLWRLAWTR